MKWGQQVARGSGILGSYEAVLAAIRAYDAGERARSAVDSYKRNVERRKHEVAQKAAAEANSAA